MTTTLTPVHRISEIIIAPSIYISLLIIPSILHAGFMKIVGIEADIYNIRAAVFSVAF